MRGPRYTSYPTALSFTDTFGVPDYVGAVRELACGTSPLSLYVHVPFCASNCFYCGCHRIVTRSRDRIDRYFDALLAELRLQSALIGRGPEIVQIHFGGGTPNSFNVGQFARLLATVQRRFRVAEAGRLELSMEVDPRICEPSDLFGWRALGFNRLSFGIQDTNEDVQRAINRVQSGDHIAMLTATARRATPWHRHGPRDARCARGGGPRRRHGRRTHRRGAWRAAPAPPPRPRRTPQRPTAHDRRRPLALSPGVP